MPTTSIRYALDPTGINSDNLVVGEVHTLSTAKYRAVAMTYGAYFTQGLVVRDHLTNTLLTKGTDYQVIEILQEATLRFGKEICLGLVVINAAISNQVRIDYQVLGGLYQNPAEGIKNAYENITTDTTIDWTNVLNKPIAYPPDFHFHLLEDVYGFEALTVSLERIKNAIILGNTPALEAIIEWVKAYVRNEISQIDELTYSELVNYDASGLGKIINFERLLQASSEYSFNAITVTPSLTVINNGDTITVTVKTTKTLDNTNLFWKIEHGTTNDHDFNTLSGFVNIVASTGTFSVSVKPGSSSEAMETFRVLIVKNNVLGPELARSQVITIQAFSGTDMANMMYGQWLYHPDVTIDADSLYMLKE